MYSGKRRKRIRIPAWRRLIGRAIIKFRGLDARMRFIFMAGSAVLVLAIVLLIAWPKSAEAQTANAAARPSDSNSLIVGGNSVTASPTFELPTPTPTATPTPTPTPTPDPTLKKGDENERVQQLQERLMKLNYLDIDESTQYYGSATKEAVEYFQRQHSLQQDGIAGPQTLELLFSSEAKKYTLLEGTRGEDVESLQRQLKRLGYLSKVTGYYGTETIAAVKAFQKENKLDVDGKTGEQTLDVIYSPKAKAHPSIREAAKRAANINKMLEVAEKQVGKTYIRGKEGPDAFDCSGLVYYCLKQAGSSRGRYNAAGYSQVSNWTKITSLSSLKKGDLIFFWSDSSKTRIGHVGIYIGGGKMIDASSSNGKVVKRSCTTPTWKKLFAWARQPWGE